MQLTVYALMVGDDLITLSGNSRPALYASVGNARSARTGCAGFYRRYDRQSRKYVPEDPYIPFRVAGKHKCPESKCRLSEIKVVSLTAEVQEVS